MIEMTTKSTDHSSEIAPYAALGSTWLATAKYANVNSPVDAMPIDRTRAPRAYASGCGAPAVSSAALGVLTTQADEQHRPGERRPRLHDLSVARQQRDERALGPVVHVPGRVAEVLPVRAAGHVQRAPQRFARHRHEQPALGHAGHLGDRVLGVGHVLEH